MVILIIGIMITTIFLITTVVKKVNLYHLIKNLPDNKDVGYMKYEEIDEEIGFLMLNMICMFIGILVMIFHSPISHFINFLIL